VGFLRVEREKWSLNLQVETRSGLIRFVIYYFHSTAISTLTLA
jgi:hypothetical protein